MSKQELYAWCSLGMSISVLVFYILIFWGWPEGIPDYSSRIVKIFFNVFWIALIGEIILDATQKKNQLNGDERDQMIAAKGYRNAYSVLSIVVVLIIVQALLSNVFGLTGNLYASMAQSTFILHSLFISLLISGITRRSTQIWFYRRDF